MRFVTALLICFCSSLSLAQRLTLNTDLYPNFTKDYSRAVILPFGGLSLNYHYRIKGQNLASGLNFRSIAWGNEVSVDQEIILPIIDGQRIILTNVNTVHFSYPLFYNKQSIGFGLSSRLQIASIKLKRFRFYGGVRFSYNNVYGEISQNAALIEGRVGTSFVLRH